MYKIRIIGTGGYLPKKIVKNNDLPTKLNTNDEWINQRTGIRQRQICGEDENVSQMGAIAGRDAIVNSGLKPEDLNVIIVATTTPNKIFPSCATQIQTQLGCVNAFCFDIQAVCSGFLYAYYIAINIMQGDIKINNALIIGSEEMSKILDWNDRSTCVLFGDGAGAAVLSKSNSIENSGYIDGILKTNGSLSEILYANHNEFLKMDGKKVFITAVSELEKIIVQICQKNNIKLSDIAHFVVHQANLRILKHLATNLNIEENKFHTTIDIHANTSAASIPLLLNHHKNHFQNGDLILMAAIGAGMTWGAILIKW